MPVNSASGINFEPDVFFPDEGVAFIFVAVFVERIEVIPATGEIDRFAWLHFFHARAHGENDAFARWFLVRQDDGRVNFWNSLDQHAIMHGLEGLRIKAES